MTVFASPKSTYHLPLHMCAGTPPICKRSAHLCASLLRICTSLPPIYATPAHIYGRLPHIYATPARIYGRLPHIAATLLHIDARLPRIGASPLHMCARLPHIYGRRANPCTRLLQAPALILTLCKCGAYPQKLLRTPSSLPFCPSMCNRIVQQGQVIKPGEAVMVLLRGPGGEMEIPFTEAIFGGPARVESRGYWLKRERAEPVLVPGVTGFGEKDKATGQQKWEETPAGSALEALLLPTPPGKAYRLLKVLTQPATPDQLARLGNDRAPVVTPAGSAQEPLTATPSAPRPSPSPSGPS